MEKDLYREMYELELTHWWFRSKRRIVLNLIQHYMNPRARPRFLDIGCGTGAMLLELEKLGEAVGLDASEEALSFARNRTGVRLIRGRVPEDLHGIEERFDCILMLDILEHLEDDAGALEAASTLLREDGFLVVTVPAYQWLYTSRDLYHHHLRRYTREGLRCVIGEAGLEVSFISYYNFLLFPAAAIQRLFSRLINMKSAPDLRLPPLPLNMAMERIFSSERFLLPHITLPWGLSVIAVTNRAAS